MKKKRAFFWHIFPAFLLVIVVVCAGMIVFSIRAVDQFHRKLTIAELKTRAVLLEPVFAPRINGVIKPAAIDSLAEYYGQRIATRITVISPKGMVLGDSDKKPSSLDNHGDRPEFLVAMRGDTGISSRFSASLQRDLMYVAVPVNVQGKRVAVLRTAIPVITVKEDISQISSHIALAGLLIALLVAAFSAALSRHLSGPIEILTAGAVRICRGDFSTKLTVPDILETARLAEAMNRMALELADRIAAITRKSGEQEAILSAMVEGVVAVDTAEHVLMINAAAGEMLGVQHEDVNGRWIQECVRNVDVQRFILELLKVKERLDQEVSVILPNGSEKELEIHGAPLRGESGEVKGAMAVMHDVTHLNRLENIRRDFVANVSHELRTPLTGIKGFVETLLDGAMEVAQDRRRFLGIINEQVNRLNLLIEDLLTISRLEKDDTQETVEMSVCSLDGPVKAAVKVIVSMAESRNIRVATGGQSGVTARINVSLFEQALINLIDNAVKYSGDGSEVTVLCYQDEKETRVSVVDQGMGIAREHIPRLFERFYRVDKARSRKMGGTGLGLSIVKHIVTVHGGTVSIESRVGKGSTFTIHLPLPQESQA